METHNQIHEEGETTYVHSSMYMWFFLECNQGAESD